MNPYLDVLLMMGLMVYLPVGLAYMINYYEYDITLSNGIKVFLFSPIWIFFIFKQKGEGE